MSVLLKLRLFDKINFFVNNFKYFVKHFNSMLGMVKEEEMAKAGKTKPYAGGE